MFGAPLLDQSISSSGNVTELDYQSTPSNGTKGDNSTPTIEEKKPTLTKSQWILTGILAGVVVLCITFIVIFLTICKKRKALPI